MKEIELKQSLHIRHPAWYKSLEPQSRQIGGKRKSSAKEIILYQVAFICISLLSSRHTPRRTKTYACVDSSSPPRSAFECNLVSGVFFGRNNKNEEGTMVSIVRERESPEDQSSPIPRAYPRHNLLSHSPGQPYCCYNPSGGQPRY